VVGTRPSVSRHQGGDRPWCPTLCYDLLPRRDRNHRWEQLTGPPLEASRSNQDDIGTLYTEAPGVEIQGTEPETQWFTPYPTNSKRRHYSALQKAKDVLKDFHYTVSHDLLMRHDTIICPTFSPAIIVCSLPKCMNHSFRESLHSI